MIVWPHCSDGDMPTRARLGRGTNDGNASGQILSRRSRGSQFHQSSRALQRHPARIVASDPAARGRDGRALVPPRARQHTCHRAGAHAAAASAPDVREVPVGPEAGEGLRPLEEDPPQDRHHEHDRAGPDHRPHCCHQVPSPGNRAAPLRLRRQRSSQAADGGRARIGDLCTAQRRAGRSHARAAAVQGADADRGPSQE